MNTDNVAGEPAGEPISTQEAREQRVAPYPPRLRSADPRELTAVRHAVMDLCRLLKQEGWIDILEEWESP